jgi:predicted DNA-binding WGR domain protein
LCCALLCCGGGDSQGEEKKKPKKKAAPKKKAKKDEEEDEGDDEEDEKPKKKKAKTEPKKKAAASSGGGETKYYEMDCMYPPPSAPRFAPAYPLPFALFAAPTAKFWEITVDGSNVTTRWGKIGSVCPAPPCPALPCPVLTYHSMERVTDSASLLFHSPQNGKPKEEDYGDEAKAEKKATALINSKTKKGYELQEK